MCFRDQTSLGGGGGILLKLQAGKKRPIASRRSARLWSAAITPLDCRVLACYRSGASIVWVSVNTQRWRGEEPQRHQQPAQSDGEVGSRVGHGSTRKNPSGPLLYQPFQLHLLPSCCYRLRSPSDSGPSCHGSPADSRCLLISSLCLRITRKSQAKVSWSHLTPASIINIIDVDLTCPHSHAAVLDSVRLHGVMDLPLMWRPGQEPFTMYHIWMFVSNPVEVFAC